MCKFDRQSTTAYDFAPLPSFSNNISLSSFFNLPNPKILQIKEKQVKPFNNLALRDDNLLSFYKERSAVPGINLLNLILIVALTFL